MKIISETQEKKRYIQKAREKKKLKGGEVFPKFRMIDIQKKSKDKRRYFIKLDLHSRVFFLDNSFAKCVESDTCGGL